MTTSQQAADVQRSLWRDANFLNLWAAQLSSSMVMGVTNVALPWLVLDMTGSVLYTSLVATLLTAPYFVLSIPAGALADRFNRRTLMLTSTLLRAAIFATIPLAAVFDVLTLAQIYVVAFLQGTLRAVFDGANFGALINVAGRARIADANAKQSAAFSLGNLVGPQVAGVLMTAIGAALTLAFNTGAYVISFFNILFIRRSFSTTAARPSKPTAFWDDIKEGARFVWQQKFIRLLTLLGFGNGLTGGGIIGTLVIFAREGHGLDAQQTGFLFAAGGVGAIIAMLLLPRLVQLFPVARVTLWGLTLNAILIWPLLLAPRLEVLLVCYAAWQGTFNLVLINGLSIRQQITPDRLQGRVNTVGRAIASGGMPIGAALAGMLAEPFNIQTAYGILAFGVALSALLAWLSPLRSFDVSQYHVDEGESTGSKPTGPQTGVARSGRR